MEQSAARVVFWTSRLETVNTETYLHLTHNGGWNHEHDITKHQSAVLIFYRAFDITDTNLVIYWRVSLKANSLQTDMC